MYEFLEGEISSKTPSQLILSVQGMGFCLLISQSTYAALPTKGKFKVLTHLYTNEEGPRLFGFYSREERDVFRLLILVSGVGPSTAMLLLSQFSPEDFAAVVAQEDFEALRRVKGIGEKSAKRIVLELKERLPKLGIVPTKDMIPSPVFRDAVSALVSIGYDRRTAEKAVQKAQGRVGNQELDLLVKTAITESAD